MKKLLSSLLTIVMLVLVGTSVMASEKDNGIEVVELSREEYLEIIAKEKGLTIEEAEKYDNSHSEKVIYRLQTQHPNLFKDKITPSAELNSYSYVKVTKPKDYPKNRDFSAQVSATLKIYSSGSFRQIVGVNGVSSRRVSGTHQYKWEENYAWTSPTADELDKKGATSIDIGADGYFVVEVPYQIGLGGFVFAGSYGNTFRYESEDMEILTTYSLYK